MISAAVMSGSDLIVGLPCMFIVLPAIIPIQVALPLDVDFAVRARRGSARWSPSCRAVDTGRRRAEQVDAGHVVVALSGSEAGRDDVRCCRRFRPGWPPESCPQFSGVSKKIRTLAPGGHDQFAVLMMSPQTSSRRRPWSASRRSDVDDSVWSASQGSVLVAFACCCRRARQVSTSAAFVAVGDEPAVRVVRSRCLPADRPAAGSCSPSVTCFVAVRRPSRCVLPTPWRMLPQRRALLPSLFDRCRWSRCRFRCSTLPLMSMSSWPISLLVGEDVFPADRRSGRPRPAG